LPVSAAEVAFGKAVVTGDTPEPVEELAEAFRVGLFLDIASEASIESEYSFVRSALQKRAQFKQR
jgi:hypothetical protein